SRTIKDLLSFPTRRSSDLTSPPAPKPSESEVNRTNIENGFVAFPNDSGVVFRVQLGAYKEIPLDVAGKFIKIESWGINNYKDEKDRKSTRLNSSHVAISYA